VSDGPSYRVPVTASQWEAVMEALSDGLDGERQDTFVARELAHLSLSIKNAIDSGWTWRMEDEA
jgi:hypothetical protein